MEEFITVIKKYAVFDGRASRKEYWMFQLVYSIIYIAVVIIFGIIGTIKLGKIIVWILTLFLLLPTITVGVRRLHDINKSGWYMLVNFIPFGALYILSLFCKKGDDGVNMYGPSPYANYQTQITQDSVSTSTIQ